MSWEARRYDVQALRRARSAIDAACAGDMAPMQAMYAAARAQLYACDPEEVTDLEQSFRAASRSDGAARQLVPRVFEAWEEVVCAATAISDPFRFRAFVWTAASLRYELGGGFDDYAAGEEFSGVSSEDGALYALMPALLGLGPWLPASVPDPSSMARLRVVDLLEIPGDHVDGIDPLDGWVMTPEALLSIEQAPSGWEQVVADGAGLGLLIRTS